ncbi:hypothetical protein FRC03_000369 [Tulasnella sp. 419]|nr:hypothetical protein FRC03_000369 [Tulasnella sp. 419]
MNFLSGSKSTSNAEEPQQQQQSGGGIMGKMSSAMGGGQSGEQKEDALDKAVDFVQERSGGGQQTNEGAFEQAKDEQISDAIRRQYKGATGKEFPIADK